MSGVHSMSGDLPARHPGRRDIDPKNDQTHPKPIGARGSSASKTVDVFDLVSALVSIAAGRDPALAGAQQQ